MLMRIRNLPILFQNVLIITIPDFLFRLKYKFVSLEL